MCIIYLIPLLYYSIGVYYISYTTIILYIIGVLLWRLEAALVLGVLAVILATLHR